MLLPLLLLPLLLYIAEVLWQTAPYHTHSYRLVTLLLVVLLSLLRR